MKQMILALVVFTFLCISCKKDDNKSSKQIIPLSVGNQWVYKYYNSEKEALVMDTIIIESTFEDGGYQVYQFSDDDYTFGEHSLFYKGSDLWGYEIPSGIATATILVPQKKTLNSQILNDDGHIRTVVSLNEKISVPAGTFSCYKLKDELDNETYILYTWICDGIGVVKYQTETKTRELVSYKIK
jgi:hypothetical protein